MVVLKFGGSSIADVQALQKLGSIVLEKYNSYNSPVITVVSAVGGTTDLIEKAIDQAEQKNKSYLTVVQRIKDLHQPFLEFIPIGADLKQDIGQDFEDLETILGGVFLIGEASLRTRDKVLGYGELLSSKLLNAYLNSLDVVSTYMDSRALLTTDSNFSQAKVDLQTSYAQIESFAAQINQIAVAPGFIARNENGIPTTLGRGGSDFTASLYAAATKAEILFIYTDVSGMYTSDPRIVKQARPLDELSYQEALELSHFGAKVLHPPSVQPVFSAGIPLYIKNTFQPEDKGTLITKEGSTKANVVSGLSHMHDIALLTIEGPSMVGTKGTSKRIFEALALAEINIILITQASSEHSLCIGISQHNGELAKKALEEALDYELETQKIYPLRIETELSIIALVGDNMRSHQGLSGKLFSTLGSNNVNVKAIAQGASERNISVVISKRDVTKALNAVHERFFEKQLKLINLFITGVGTVGSKLLNILSQQKDYFEEELRLQLRVCAISNSRKMYFDPNGLNISNWAELLEQGESADMHAFQTKVQDLNLRNSVFVDNTASEHIASCYEAYLDKSIAVVTCNKIASSSKYERYANLKALSKKYQTPFLFETNVGAGLPIIDTIKQLVDSGDQIRSIKAVLSGSLNFIFDSFNDEVKFVDIVKQAMQGGYTEPDPRIDLSGTDVKRKILILARESGYELEMQDIASLEFLPETCRNTKDVDSFLKELDKNQEHFTKLFLDAQKEKAKLKFAASFVAENKNSFKASVGLEKVDMNNDFYHLSGSDNIILIYTDRYRENPLVIKGAGAGADVTASGIVGDIIRSGNHLE